MAEHVLGDILSVTMEKLRTMVDVNTIVGTPINTPDGITLIPVSKVSFGFASGGSDFGAKQNTPIKFGGGAGAGVTITPIAFLVVNNGNVKMLSVSSPANTTVDRIVDMVPDVVDKKNESISSRKAKKEEE